MKISLLISAIIVGLASVFGLQQKKEIKTLTAQWEVLKATATEKHISTDPEATFSLQRVRSESSRAAREKAINQFAADLIAFAQKMEEAKKDGNQNDPEIMKEVMVFMDKLTNMSPSDLKSLIQVLSADSSIKDKTKQELVMMSIMLISADHPEAALTIISESGESLGIDKRNRHLIPMVIQQYAAKDPIAAATWVTENSALLGDKADEIKNQIVMATAYQDFSSALAMIDTLELEDPNQAFGFLAVGLKAGDQDQFMQALDESDITETQRRAALSSLVNSPFVTEDFEASTAWLESPALAADDREAFIESLHYHSVRQNPQDWLTWVSDQEVRSETTSLAYQQILEGWTRNNYVASGEWVGSQEPGPARNAAVETYASTLALHEPAAAAEWAETLPPGENRTELFKKIHQGLLSNDPDSAADFANRHQLPVE